MTFDAGDSSGSRSSGLALQNYTRDDLLDKARAKHVLLERQAMPHLGAFAHFHDPVLVIAKALAPLYAVWDRIYKGEQVYALIEAPPRHGKSVNCFYGFARHLRKYPKHLIGYGTYNGDFAAQQSRLARRIAEKCGVWAHDQENVTGSRFEAAQTISHWQTSQGGGGKFFGRGTSALGSGFNVALIDDPIKDPSEAESALTLDECWEWALAAVFNRMEPGGSFLCMHQRWTMNDLIGRFKARIESGYKDAPPELRRLFLDGSFKWEIVTLRAIQDDGQPLMPERFDLLALARIRLEVTDFWWFAQYMQDPRPRSGRMFAEHYPSWEPVRNNVGEEQGVLIAGEFIPIPDYHGKTWVFGIDTAGSESVNADYTAIVLMLIGWEYDSQTERDEICVDVVHVWREQLNSPDVVTYVNSIVSELPNATIAFEVMGPGAAQGQFLKVQFPELNITEIRTHKSKRLRAGPMANFSKRGRVRLPLQGAWVGPFKKELINFTGQEGQRDDQVDAAVHAFNLGLLLPRPTRGRQGRERGSGRGQGGI